MKKLFLGIIFILIANILLAADKFPYRKNYPKAPTISTQELKSQYNRNEVIFIDVRSMIEYKIIHPKKSIHVPIATISFLKKIRSIIQENRGKNFAFYCNGVNCLKSYEAVEKVIKKLNCKNCFAYDAGITDWANLYPSETLLLEQKITNPDKQLISESAFNKKLISFEKFKEKAKQPNTIVIDARDPIQRTSKLPGLKRVHKVKLDDFIPSFLKYKRFQNKTLLIFDQVGKQVKWLMYYLKDYGYKDFYFLEKGATGVLGKQEYRK